MSGSSTICPSPARTPSLARRALVFALDPVGRMLLAAVFLVAALTKFADLGGFRDRLVLHSGLPVALTLTVAYLLPALELTCGFCLLLGVCAQKRRWSRPCCSPCFSFSHPAAKRRQTAAVFSFPRRFPLSA